MEMGQVLIKGRIVPGPVAENKQGIQPSPDKLCPYLFYGTDKQEKRQKSTTPC